MLNLNKFAEEVHANAERHGWWDGDIDFAEICALIHSEWSEALEEARANRDMVWTGENGKPEGIAVELIDGVIRILDWICKERIEIFPATINSIMEVWSKERKNADYGDSFHQTFQLEGMAMSRIRLMDKLNRFCTLTRKGEQRVNDESIRDTLLDMANYAIMTVMEMEG